MESGNKIKCLVRVFYTTQIMKSPTTESGRMINYKARELSTMKKSLSLANPLTIKIGKKLMTTGSSTRESFLRIAKTAMVNFIYQMVKSSRVASGMTWSREKATFFAKMQLVFMVSGRKIN